MQVHGFLPDFRLRSYNQIMSRADQLKNENFTLRQEHYKALEKRSEIYKALERPSEINRRGSIIDDYADVSTEHSFMDDLE